MADDLKILEKGLYKRWRASVVSHQLNSSSGDGDDSGDEDDGDGVIRPSQLIDLSFLGDLMAEKAEYLSPYCHYRLLSLCADKVVMIYLALLKDGQKTGGCYFQANGPGTVVDHRQQRNTTSVVLLFLFVLLCIFRSF